MVVTYSMALPVTSVSNGIDAHYEAVNRLVWNERECRYEERGFVYEVSWIQERGVWRHFLRPQKPA
jgi:hypothetical protein